MNDEQLLRYSRQIMLPQVDINGQEKLRQSTVLVIGLGGLGSPVVTYLASAGIGTLIISDFDTVELSNLQRQPIHTTQDIGQRKTASARSSIAALNPEIEVICLDEKLSPEELTNQVRRADVVIDASDNFETRFLINRVCVSQRTPLVSGAAIRWEGQVAVFNNSADSPCYRCLYRDDNEPAERCSETGVIAPVVGIIGCIQATEAIKLLLNIGETLHARLLILDALTMEWRRMNLRKDPQCPDCSLQT